MVREWILKECEDTYLEYCNTVQFGRNVYDTALRNSMFNEIKQRHMLQYINLQK
jgi:hypothetical protein